MEHRTRTIIINNATNETPHHQRMNQELRAKNAFGNNEYETNNVKTRTTLNVFWLFAASVIFCFVPWTCVSFWCLLLFSVVVVGALSFVLARCFYCCVWFACVHCLWSCLCSKKSKEINEHEYGTKNNNNNNNQRHKRNTINARTKKSERRTHSVTTNIEQTM